MENLAAFKKLSVTLQAKIQSRPTKTILKESTSKTIEDYKAIGKLFNEQDPNPAARAPEAFDGRVVWKSLLGEVEDQGGCGSCWAFASTTSLAQRFNIQSRGLMNIRLSQTKLILCDWGGKELTVDHPELPEFSSLLVMSEEGALNESACYGNTLLDACRYLYEIGTPTEECVPYDKILDLEIGDFQKIGAFNRGSPAATQLPLCTTVAGPLGDMCAGSHVDVATGEEVGVPERFFRAFHFYGLYGVSEQEAESLTCNKNDKKCIALDAKLRMKSGTGYSSGSGDQHGGDIQIRREIWRWGPVATGMKVYPDFYTFDAKNDIYDWDGRGPQVGGHAIVLLGWGEERGKKYWIVRNSWGPDWGDGGYFKMARGTNLCEIESNVLCMIPDYFYPTGFSLGDKRSSLTPTSDDTSEHELRLAGGAAAESAGKISGTSSFRENRDEISDNVLVAAGGIDPLTGYTRRVMITMPWVDFQRPVFLEDLPKWETFVAGIDSSPAAIKKVQAANEGRREKDVNASQIGGLYVGLVSVLILLVVIVSGIIIYRKVKQLPS